MFQSPHLHELLQSLSIKPASSSCICSIVPYPQSYCMSNGCRPNHHSSLKEVTHPFLLGFHSWYISVLTTSSSQYCMDISAPGFVPRTHSDKLFPCVLIRSSKTSLICSTPFWQITWCEHGSAMFTVDQHSY